MHNRSVIFRKTKPPITLQSEETKQEDVIPFSYMPKRVEWRPLNRQYFGESSSRSKYL